MANVIKVTLNNKNDYVSKFNDDILSKDLNEYILEECKEYGFNSEIVIEITCKYDIDTAERQKIVDMIRSSFGNEISEMLVYRKRNIHIDIVIFLTGIIAVSFYLFFSNVKIISELILVISWVLIWEGVHNLIFEGLKNRIDIERKKRLTRCKIIFTR